MPIMLNHRIMAAHSIRSSPSKNQPQFHSPNNNNNDRLVCCTCLCAWRGHVCNDRVCLVCDVTSTVCDSICSACPFLHDFVHVGQGGDCMMKDGENETCASRNKRNFTRDQYVFTYTWNEVYVHHGLALNYRMPTTTRRHGKSCVHWWSKKSHLYAK